MCIRDSSKVVAITCTIFLFLGLICGTLYFVALQLVDILDIWPELQKRTVILFEDVEKWVKVALPGGKKWVKTNSLSEVSLEYLSNNGPSILLSATSLLAEMTLIPLYMFFILYYRHFFREVLYRFLGKKEEERINHILYRVYDVIHNYLSGIFIVMVIVGTLNTMSLVMLSIPYAIFFGFFAAFLLLIPYIGIMIGALLPIIMALITKDSAMYGVGVAVAFSLIQFLEGNFITPYVVGSKISINPLMSIIALLIGALVWGVAGMALALPIVAIVKVICDHFTDLKPIGYMLGDPFELQEDDNNKAEVEAKEIAD
jgi:predicted PurR-regulated permease PerM